MLKVSLLALVLTGCGSVSFNVTQPFGDVGNGPVTLSLDLNAETAKRALSVAKLVNVLTLDITSDIGFDGVSGVAVFANSPELGARQVCTLQVIAPGVTRIALICDPLLNVLPFMNNDVPFTATITGTPPSGAVYSSTIQLKVST